MLDEVALMQEMWAPKGLNWRTFPLDSALNMVLLPRRFDDKMFYWVMLVL
jgi:hypothetical protein